MLPSLCPWGPACHSVQVFSGVIHSWALFKFVCFFFSFLSLCCDQISDKNSLKAEGIVWAHGKEGMAGFTVTRVLQLDRVRKQRAGDAATHQCLLFAFSVKDCDPWDGASQVQGRFPVPSVKPLSRHLIGTPEASPG